MDYPTCYIADLFPSIEGEGPAVGTPTLFIRFAGCDFQCPFCDTKESWDTEHAKTMTVDVLLREVHRLLLTHNGIHRVSITGGNPFLYKEQLQKLFNNLCMWDEVKEVNFEHPGILIPTRDNILEEGEFLSVLNDGAYDSGTKVHINMDVKYPLWDKTQPNTLAYVKAHNELINFGGFLFKAKRLQKMFTGNFKVILDTTHDVYCFLQTEKELVRGFEPESNFGFYATLIRNTGSDISEDTKTYAIHALMKETLSVPWKMNANMHVLWDIK